MARRVGGLGRGLDALLDNNDDDQFVKVDVIDGKFDNSEDGGDVDEFDIFDSPVSVKKKVPAAPSAPAVSAQDIVQLPTDKLIASPGQPRKHFDETELQELADSIKTYGVIQPVIAANAGDGTYIIIAGERRTRAARLAGLDTVPVIIRDYTDQKRLEVSLIENIQRTDLNPIEEAGAYKNLMDFSNLSQDDLAARLGKNRSTVANALRLLKLPIEIQKSVKEGKVSSGHARALLSVTDTRAREKLYREILDNEVSVREAEKRASVLNAEGGNEKASGKSAGKAASSKKRSPEIEAMTEKFISKLGTKVIIEGDLNKGRILIDYFSMEDLDRLYEVLGG